MFAVYILTRFRYSTSANSQVPEEYQTHDQITRNYCEDPRFQFPISVSRPQTSRRRSKKYIPLCSPKSLAHLAMWIFISGLMFFLSSPPALFPSSSTGGTCTLFLPISCTSSCAQSSVCTVFSPAVASKSARSFESSYEGGSGWRTFDLRCRTKSKAAIAMSATTPTPPSEAPIMSGR
jgi:hypothetical protein